MMIPILSGSSTRCRGVAVILLLSAILSEGLAKTPRAAASEGTSTEAVDRSEAADDLGRQVAEIANSSAISRAKKEKRISTAVRVAVVAATAYKRNSDEILGTALELAEAAGHAAPHFAEVIANAVSFAPPLARIDAAAGRIRSATFAAAKSPLSGHRTKVATRKVRPPVPAPVPDETAATEEVAESPPARRVARPNPRARADASVEVAEENAAMEAPSNDGSLMTPGPSLNANSKFSVTADLSVRHDDNVYLTNADKVGDTIIAVTPGVEFRYGQNSLAHGSFSYKNAFTRYADKTAPNVSLGSGSGDFGYDNGTLTVGAAASFQQVNQNNADVAALGQQAIFRRDLTAASGSVESHLTAKTSLKTGVNYSKSEYKNANLTGDQETEIPLKFYFETTPKVSLSTGVAYRWVNPQNGGEKGHDLDYSVGARGNFTAKLNGEFSLDYRTRSVGDNDRENLWGLNGALNYELTPKTSSTLVFSRDFNTGALGESLKNSSYALKLSTDLSPQWLVGGGVTFRQVEYGPSVFRINTTPTLIDRNDQYWEGNLQASYLYRSWLSATADFTLRRNHSTVSGAEFTNAILSFMLGWRY